MKNKWNSYNLIKFIKYIFCINIKYCLLFSIFFVSINQNLYGNDSTKKSSKFDIYFMPEVSGFIPENTLFGIFNNFAISCNIELIYLKNYAIRIGYGYGEARTTRLFSKGYNDYEFEGFVAMFNYILGDRNKFEIGAGLNIIEERNVTGKKSWQHFWPAGSIAYRYSPDPSFYFRVGATFVYGGGWPLCFSLGFRLF
jgi:hypothetical protein